MGACPASIACLKVYSVLLERTCRSARSGFDTSLGASGLAERLRQPVEVRSGEVLALANWASYDPNDCSKLTGDQLHYRVMTDTFEAPRYKQLDNKPIFTKRFERLSGGADMA